MSNGAYTQVYDMMYRTFKRSMSPESARRAATIHARKYLDRASGSMPTTSGTLGDRIADIG